MSEIIKIVCGNTIYSDNFKLDYLTGGWIVVDREKMIRELEEALLKSNQEGFEEGEEIGKAWCETHHEEMIFSALKAEREKMLQELKDTCTQIDDNEQYYMWLEDVESVLLRGEP